MNVPQKHRIFFALWPDAEEAAHLAALGQNLAAGCVGRATPAENMHLTLAFIGAVTPVQLDELIAIAAEVRAESFDLRLDRLGFWPQGGVLWVGCRQPPSHQCRLYEALADCLRAAEFRFEARLFAPHVTLARRARCASLPRLGTPLGWRVSEFALVESIAQPLGVRYETRANFALDPA